MRALLAILTAAMMGFTTAVSAQDVVRFKVKELVVSATEEPSTVTPLKSQTVDGCTDELLIDAAAENTVQVFLNARTNGSTVTVVIEDTDFPEEEDSECFVLAASPGKTGIPVEE